MEPDYRTALVTGASSGIGAAMARRLAADRTDLVLVARDAARLEALAVELRSAHGVTAEVLPADLTDPAALRRVEERLADPERAVDLLVNNAGMAVRSGFVDGDVDEQEHQLDLLVRAPMRLCAAALPGMLDRRRGALLNVSSVAGWMPFGSYAAAKAWLTTFTEGLAAELAGSGVTATALCPGYVRTEFHARMQVRRSGPSWAWLEPEQVVDEGLADCRRGKVVSVPSRRYAVAATLLQAVPRPLLRRGMTARMTARVRQPL